MFVARDNANASELTVNVKCARTHRHIRRRARSRSSLLLYSSLSLCVLRCAQRRAVRYRKLNAMQQSTQEINKKRIGIGCEVRALNVRGMFTDTSYTYRSRRRPH